VDAWLYAAERGHATDRERRTLAAWLQSFRAQQAVVTNGGDIR
jgi:hypothetical protein